MNATKGGNHKPTAPSEAALVSDEGDTRETVKVRADCELTSKEAGKDDAGRSNVLYTKLEVKDKVDTIAS